MILSKQDYIASINTLLPDNSTQQISPLDLRTSLINLVDSVVNFIDGDICADNFCTPESRNTRGGVLALSQLDLAGRSAYDTSAYGYASLKNSYNGVENTALGSYSLSCSLYGSNNTAVGFSSLVGKVNGSGNIGLGSYALANNKQGDFNIAIGHGAGHYMINDSYKLVVGSYPIETESLCDENEDPITTGVAPLLFGDLNPSDHRLAIGTNSLHPFGMLQVSGDVSPTLDEAFNLGNEHRSWNSINEIVYFSGGLVGVGGQPSGLPQGLSPRSKMTVHGDLLPSESGKFALGHPALPWDGYFNDMVVSGQLHANDVVYNNISECLYECKTLHLATSGFCDPDGLGFHNSSVCGFLSDQSLDGAGFEVHSSGHDYRRDYRFIYRSPDPIVECLDDDSPFSRGRWQSNISMQIESGRHLQTDRIINNNDAHTLGLIHQSGCMGYFVEPFEEKGQRAIIAQEPHVDNKYTTLKDVNMISRSGETVGLDGNPVGYDYSVMYGTVDSGVQVAQKFNSRIKSASTIKGFSIVYHDEIDT